MTIATTDFEFLAALISGRTGNVITPNQDYLLESRLSGLLRDRELNSIGSLVARLRSNEDSELSDHVADVMTINETSFFRDPDIYSTLREHVIPELIEQRRASKELSIWCAASSSGQEPYSLAMLLEEHFPELGNWQVNILCTDYSRRMVDRTRNGDYSQFEANRGLPAKMLVKFFDRKGLHWIAKDDLRNRMEFKVCNLTRPWTGIPKMDLVMLRNVLIYFSKSVKEQVLAKTHGVLRGDGYLFLGGGETLVNLESPFRKETLGKSPVYRPQNDQDSRLSAFGENNV